MATKPVKAQIDSGNLDIHHPVTGQRLYILNPFIFNEKQVWHNLDLIKDMHILKQVIYVDIEQETNPNRLQQLASDLQEVEFELQRLWGFKEDARFHKFWEYPKCTCPKMDNNDSYPSGRYSIHSNCPLHGYETSSGSGKGL
jgi:hypothetical protein